MPTNFSDLQNRVSEISWEGMKGIIPPQREKNDLSLPPEYGYVIDMLRINYKIYITIYPRTNIELDSSQNSIFEWVGKINKINDIDKIKLIIVIQYPELILYT